MMTRRMRTEHDSIGEMAIPAEADYGIHTARAVENFPITGITLSNFPEFIESLAMVKKAAALANRDFGRLTPEVAQAIVSACDLVIAGDEHHDFVVDMLQGGAGTSTNMNANEVIANLALKLLGKPRGDYATINPNDHVNLSQSTNDVYPTAVRLTVLPQLAALADAGKLKDPVILERQVRRLLSHPKPTPARLLRSSTSIKGLSLASSTRSVASASAVALAASPDV
jgi:aspartate ammonia-lyase